MPRENAADKARRYLTEGRLTITHLSGPHVRATCKGDGAVYRVTGYGPPETWLCDCPAKGRCAHRLAVGLVVDTHGRYQP